MDPRELLDTWLAGSALRPSTQAAYHREVTSWLTWCHTRDLNPYTTSARDIATWAHDLYLHPYLPDRPLDSHAALAELAERHPEAGKSHDRRITALTGYYDAAHQRHLTPRPPDLTLLRTSVNRVPDEPRKLTPRERAVFLATVGAWGPHRARYYWRDQLVAYLLLDRLRPAQLVRLDMRLMYEQPDGSIEVRIPDEHDATGAQRVLDPLTGAAIKNYLPHRPEPRPGVHELVLGKDGRPVQSRYPNLLIRQIAATHPLLADRVPPVTADVIAHTGLWDDPSASQ